MILRERIQEAGLQTLAQDCIDTGPIQYLVLKCIDFIVFAADAI